MVLACDRRNCPRVMCDYYSVAYGYICYGCRSELVDLVARELNTKPLALIVQDFMASSPMGDADLLRNVAINTVDQIFPDRS